MQQILDGSSQMLRQCQQVLELELDGVELGLVDALEVMVDAQTQVTQLLALALEVPQSASQGCRSAQDEVRNV